MSKTFGKMGFGRKDQGGSNPDYDALLATGELKSIPMDQVKRDPEQPRPLSEVMEGIEDFAAELNRNGIIQPPVYNIMPDGTYRILAGERRTEAWRLNNNPQITAIVKVWTPDEAKKIFELQYAENDENNRKPLSPMADALWWKSYIERYHDGNQAAAALDRGKNKTFVSDKLAILKASDPLLEFIKANSISDATTIRLMVAMEKKDPNSIEKLKQAIESGQDGSLRTLVSRISKGEQEVVHAQLSQPESSHHQSTETFPAGMTEVVHAQLSNPKEARQLPTEAEKQKKERTSKGSSAHDEQAGQIDEIIDISISDHIGGGHLVIKTEKRESTFFVNNDVIRQLKEAMKSR